jgi:hypothetical protein
MAEIKLDKYFIREFDIKKEDYIEVFEKHPGIIKFPYFDKTGFCPAPGEGIVLHVKKTEASGSVTAMVRKKKKKDFTEQTVPVFSGSGIPGSWEFILSNERALAYIKGTKAMAGLLATPLAATYLRNTYITVQQPLHAITEIGFVFLKKGLRTKVLRPHELYINFNTGVGKFVMGVVDVGNHSFGDYNECLSKLSIMRDEIIKNKKYIAEYLLYKKILKESVGKEIIRDLDEQRNQKIIVEEKKKGKELINKYRLSSIDFGIPIYANDLRKGYQILEVKEE